LARPLWQKTSLEQSPDEGCKVIKVKNPSLLSKPNRPPSDGLQFFGQVKIDGKSEVMTVSSHNLLGEKIYSVELTPES
jgi:alkaline phosphatase D